MVPPTSDQVSRVWPYSGYCALSSVFAYMTFTFSGGTSHSLRLTVKMLKAVRNPESISTPGLASSAFARHYLRNLG